MADSQTGISSADERFLRILVGHDEAVLTAYATRPSRWIHITQAYATRSRIRNLAAFVRFLFRIFVGMLAPGEQSADVVWSEYFTNLERTRGAFLRRFLPDFRVDFVGVESRPVRVPRGTRMAGMLWGLLQLILSRESTRPGVLGCRYVHVAEYCLTVLGHAYRTTTKQAYLCRIYQDHVPALAAFLRAHGVGVHLVTNTGPLQPAELSIPADSMKLTHPFQVYYAMQFSDPVAVERLDLWGPMELSQMDTAYRGRLRDGPSDVVAVYTQGYWLRLQQGTLKEPALVEYARVEDELMQAMLQYLELHPDVSVVVFLHPMEKRHFASTSELGPWRLLEHPRATCVTSLQQHSNEAFDRARVGVTTFSTVGYDRTYMGFPTVFYRGNVTAAEDQVESPFSALFVRRADELFTSIDAMRAVPAEQFMLETFGGPLAAWKPNTVTAGELAHFRSSRTAQRSGCQSGEET
ncbi:MAG: hypothetical protein Kow0067_07050 [Coriobacteriia bacterium]